MTRLGWPAVRAARIRATGLGLALCCWCTLAGCPDLPVANGLVAPAGVPPAVIARLNAEIARIMRDPAISGPLVANGFEVIASTPAEIGERLKNDVAKFDDIVKKSGAKVD
jgi:tripartite-type tricarboxylate transporter receptor subunit TctC